MIAINDGMREHMRKMNYKHILLNIDEFKSWCAPPRKEVSVSFTDEEPDVMAEKGYACESCEAGNIYYPKGGLIFTADASVNYMEYPWITCCETVGIDFADWKTGAWLPESNPTIAFSTHWKGSSDDIHNPACWHNGVVSAAPLCIFAGIKPGNTQMHGEYKARNTSGNPTANC